MPVPKRKTSKSRRDKRQSCKFIRPQSITKCSNCDHPLATHTACDKCGYYKGAKVLTTKLERTLKRGETREAQRAKAQAKEMSEAGHDHNHENEK